MYFIQEAIMFKIKATEPQIWLILVVRQSVLVTVPTSALGRRVSGL